MKKKIKDFTLGEINKICQSAGCSRCPFKDLDSDCPLKTFEMEHILRIRLENINYELVREKQDNKNKLTAFKIIKEKRVDIIAFIEDFVEGHDTYNEYYENADEYHYYRKGDYETPLLTQNEFDSVKKELL